MEVSSAVGAYRGGWRLGVLVRQLRESGLMREDHVRQDLARVALAAAGSVVQSGTPGCASGEVPKPGACFTYGSLRGLLSLRGSASGYGCALHGLGGPGAAGVVCFYGSEYVSGERGGLEHRLSWLERRDSRVGNPPSLVWTQI